MNKKNLKQLVSGSSLYWVKKLSVNSKFETTRLVIAIHF
jgi:hypothetical protein